MYVGVDIGGTKTLVAALDDHGVIVEKIRLHTPPTYEEFIEKLRTTTASLDTKDFKAACVAIPGKVDRERGIAEHFGNLTWQHVPVQADAERIFGCPVLIENDANLGALSESMLLPSTQHVLYITLSTGIGTGFIMNRQIAPELADSEGGQMPLEYHGKRVTWEDFASGRAIVERFGQKARDITDEKIWQRIAHDLSLGVVELMAVTQPDIIVFGGSVGRYLERFRKYLLAELQRYNNPLLPVPELRAATRPNEAVLYGCYDLAHAKYGTNT